MRKSQFVYIRSAVITKFFSGFFIILLLACIFCGSIGCESEYNRNIKRIKETEYFRYINYEGEDTVTILELTELGKQQEVLVIPEEIDGMPVIGIGGTVAGGSLFPRPTYTIKSDILKKIYVKLNNIDRGAFYGNCNTNQKIVIINQDIYKSIDIHDFFTRNAYFYFYDATEVLDFFETYSRNDDTEYLNEANIRFWVNDTLWWLDIAADEQYVTPENPKREGMTFIGWYTDSEFTNAWDGEYVIPEGKEALNLYANFE